MNLEELRLQRLIQGILVRNYVDTQKLDVQGVVLTVPTPTIIVRKALEEIGYHGFLTVRPMPGRSATAQFKAISDRLNQVG